MREVIVHAHAPLPKGTAVSYAEAGDRPNLKKFKVLNHLPQPHWVPDVFHQVHGHSVRTNVRWVHPSTLPCDRENCHLTLVKPCPRPDVMRTCGRDFVFLTDEATCEPVRSILLH